MSTSSGYAYNIHFTVNYLERTLPVSRSLAAANDDEAIAAFRAWCAEHPDGFENDPYIQRPFLMKQRVLDRG